MAIPADVEDIQTYLNVNENHKIGDAHFTNINWRMLTGLGLVYIINHIDSTRTQPCICSIGVYI